MAKSIAKRLEQITSDFNYVSSKYGDVIDFTASGMESQHLSDLLAAPTKTTAFNCYKDRLHDIFESGYEISDRETKILPFFDDERLQEIGDRYLLPIPEISL